MLTKLLISSQPRSPENSLRHNSVKQLRHLYAINGKVSNINNISKRYLNSHSGNLTADIGVINGLMKNKLEVDFVTSEKFGGDLPVNEVRQQRVPKTNLRRESITPKIVVCPPIEEMSEPMAAPRGGRLLKALTRRLSRRATDADSMGSSSSNESMSGENGRVDDRSSCSASDSGSDGSERNRRHRSTVSLRRVFQSLSLTARSQSSSPTERSRPPKKQTQPKRILRPPVTYTYVRGLSGLPTQRVPRHTVYCASMGLNR